MMSPPNLPPMNSSPYGQPAFSSGSVSTVGGMPQGSGAYNHFGSGPYSRGAPTVGAPPQDGLAGYLAKYKELNPTKRLLVLLAPFCLIASAYLLLFDDEPAPQPREAALVDAGAHVAAQPSCPQGFVPYTIPVNGTIPCVPLGTPMPGSSIPFGALPTQPTPPVTPVGQVPPTHPSTPTTAPTQVAAIPPAPAPAPAPMPAGTAKTLERQAVDAVAVNDYARAAAIYEMLLQQNPNNRVYAEAARILHQKANAGVAQQQ